MRALPGFSLVEAMASVAMAAVLLIALMGTYGASINTRAESSQEWTAFTIAQTRMEMLNAAPRLDAVLNDLTTDVIAQNEIGGISDTQCASGVDGSLSLDMRVDELGNPTAAGKFLVCWKITDGHPSGNLKNVRVVAGYPAKAGMQFILLQTFR